jgi:hypothetical protein
MLSRARRKGKLARRRKREDRRATRLRQKALGAANTLFVFFRAWPDAVVRSLRVHDLIRVILHGARYPLDAVKLFGAGGKCIRNRFVGSHFYLRLMSQY